MKEAPYLTGEGASFLIDDGCLLPSVAAVLGSKLLL